MYSIKLITLRLWNPNTNPHDSSVALYMIYPSSSSRLPSPSISTFISSSQHTISPCTTTEQELNSCCLFSPFPPLLFSYSPQWNLWKRAQKTLKSRNCISTSMSRLPIPIAKALSIQSSVSQLSPHSRILRLKLSRKSSLLQWTTQWAKLSCQPRTAAAFGGSSRISTRLKAELSTTALSSMTAPLLSFSPLFLIFLPTTRPQSITMTCRRCWAVR